MIRITDFFFGELKQKRVSEPGPEKEEALLADREAGGQHRGSGTVEVEAPDASHAVDLIKANIWFKPPINLEISGLKLQSELEQHWTMTVLGKETDWELLVMLAWV